MSTMAPALSGYDTRGFHYCALYQLRALGAMRCDAMPCLARMQPRTAGARPTLIGNESQSDQLQAPSTGDAQRVRLGKPSV